MLSLSLMDTALNYPPHAWLEPACPYSMFEIPWNGNVHHIAFQVEQSARSSRLTKIECSKLFWFDCWRYKSNSHNKWWYGLPYPGKKLLLSNPFHFIIGVLLVEFQDHHKVHIIWINSYINDCLLGKFKQIHIKHSLKFSIEKEQLILSTLHYEVLLLCWADLNIHKYIRAEHQCVAHFQQIKIKKKSNQYHNMIILVELLWYFYYAQIIIMFSHSLPVFSTIHLQSDRFRLTKKFLYFHAKQ